MRVNSRQALSRNKMSNFSEIHSWKQGSGSAIIWLRQYTNNSETILLCNRCACNWKTNSQTINACNWRVHRKHLMKAPNYTKEFLPDVLCNWEINSQVIRMRVIGPLSILVLPMHPKMGGEDPPPKFEEAECPKWEEEIRHLT